MQEINDNQINPEAMANLKAQQASEAFLNLATDIGNDSVANEKNTINDRDRSIATNTLNMGPKYLNALKQIEALNDTRAFEAQLPIIKTKFEITAMTGEEEQSLKSASISPENFLRRLNEIIYNHLTFLDSEKPNFKDFLTNLYPPDKTTLIWSLLVSSYAVLPSIEKECESCGKNYIIEKVPKDIMHEDTFRYVWDKSVPPGQYTETQAVFNGFITFEFGMPSEKDRIIISSMITPQDLKKNVEQKGNLLDFADTIIYFTKSITIDDGDTKTVLTDVMQDLYPFMKNLSPKLLDGIKAELDVTMFDKYIPQFYLNAKCTHCGFEEKIDVDPELTFFRKAISV